MGVLSGPSQKPTFFGVLASLFTQRRFKIGVWGFNCSHQKKQLVAAGIPARWWLSQINYTLTRQSKAPQKAWLDSLTLAFVCGVMVSQFWENSGNSQPDAH
jgi:hypothetical protein